MKKSLVFLLLVVLSAPACNNNKSKKASPATGPVELKTDSNGRQPLSLDDLEKQKEELVKLTPLSTDQMKALIPETLMGAKKTNGEISSSIGVNMASGEYEINDSTSIVVNVYDCSGPGGSGFYGLHMAGILNNLHENEQDYIKAVDFNGGKAYEQCDKTTDQCTFSYFAGGKLLVTLEGDHVDIETLKQAARGLNIK